MKAKVTIIQYITNIYDNNYNTAMAPFYSHVCQVLKKSVEKTVLSRLQQENKKQLDELQKQLQEAEEKFGETEIADCLLLKADYLASIGEKASFLNNTL